MRPRTRTAVGLLAATMVVCQALVATPPARAQAQPGAAYLLLELPSRRVVAQARPEILDAAIAPGSLMKVFALVAAFESGAADTETRVVCRRSVDVDGRVLTCVHPDMHRALSPDEALAHSCNVYFATLARRLRRDALDAVLVRSGLPPTSPESPLMRVALGLEGVQATPRRWLDAFIRVTATDTNGTALAGTARDLLQRGLRAGARIGTADALGADGFEALAKTGTAPMPGGGFLGLVAATVGGPRPTHAIIVVAPGTSGANAARLAAQTLAAHGVSGSARPAPTMPGTSSVIARPAAGPLLRVGSATPGGRSVVSSVTLEDLVARGVAGEGGDTLPPAAREALAIVIRSFALHHVGRHAGDGFDLCDLTHCLSLRPATDVSRAAAGATRGRVLLHAGRLAGVYFSASCGGHTERPSAVWSGAENPPYLPSQTDSVCQRDAGWASELTEPQVRRALRAAGLRGDLVTRLTVASRTTSGRVSRLAVGGLVPEQVDAEAFRLAAGRQLGWQVLKSSWYDVTRTGPGFRFSGRGHGHGVGLCVRGAGLRAAGGANAVAILGTYFPGTAVGLMRDGPDVRVTLPAGEQHHLSSVRAMIGAQAALLAARLAVAVPWRIEVVFHPTVEAYTRATGMPWWSAGRTRDVRVDLLPLSVLRRRGTLEQTVRHELVHVLTADILAGRPLWIHEGLAQVMAADGPSSRLGPPPTGGCPTDDQLRGASGADAWRRTYAAAARCVAAALAKDPDWTNLR